MRYRVKLTSHKTGKKNRAQNNLTTSNIQLGQAFSEVFDKSATAILNHMLANPYETNFDVTPFVEGRCKTPVEEIQLSIDGKLSHEQTEKLNVIRSHMDNLDICKKNLESIVYTVAEQFLSQINLVSTVPGVKHFSAIAAIAENGTDMSVFPRRNTFVLGQVLPRNATKAAERRSQAESVTQVLTSSRVSLWFVP